MTEKEKREAAKARRDLIRERVFVTVAFALECVGLWTIWQVHVGTQAVAGVLLAITLHTGAALLSAIPQRAGIAKRAAFISTMIFPPMAILARFLDVWVGAHGRDMDPEQLGQMLYGFKADKLELWTEGIMQKQSAREEDSNTAPGVLLLAPVASVLGDESVPTDLKVVAVRNLTHLRPEDSVPLLREAMKRDEPAIRYTAAKLLSNLEASFSERLQKSYSSGSGEDIAFAMLDFADSGLLDPSDARRHRQNAIDVLTSDRKVSDSGSSDDLVLPDLTSISVEGLLVLARALFELDRCRESLAVAAALLQKDPENPAGHRHALSACLKMGDYREFRRLARKLAADYPDRDLGRELTERFPNQATSA